MPFIDTIPPEHCEADVRAMYERQHAHYGFIPNYAGVFSHRPEILRLWAQLQAGIKRTMDKRRFELVTFVAACELKSTLCALAHGRALTAFVSEADVQALAKGLMPPALTEAERAIVALARKVARDASAVTAADVARVKAQGLSDGEVFDVVACAAARSFWTKVIEGLGVEADPRMCPPEGDLMDALTVGRPVDFSRQAPSGQRAVAR